MQILGQDRRRQFGPKRENRVVLVFLLALSVVMSVTSLYTAQASVFDKARKSVLDASAPVLQVLSGPVRLFDHVVGDVRDYFGVVGENRRLKEQVAELQAWRHEALRLRETIARYDRIMNLQTPPEAKYIDALVVGASNSEYRHTMIVNAGARASVEDGAAVVDDYGLIGRVLFVANKASRILLLTDINSRIPVFVEGADVHAIMVGRNARRPRLQFVESSEPVTLKRGERVITSGRGGALPRGLPVGVIGEVSDDGASVALYANFDRTEQVRVINYDFPLDVEKSGNVEKSGGADDGSSAEG